MVESVSIAASDASFFAFLRRVARLDEDAPAALHQRVADAFRAGISETVIGPGALIPGERELSKALGVSRVTVRRAIKALVDDRLLVRRPGARTSIAERVEKPVSLLTSFSQDMLSRGLRPGTIWLGRQIGPAQPAEALALALSPGEQVCRLARLRTADGKPMALEWSVLPAAVLSDPALVTDSLYAALAESGTVPVRALQRMRATVAAPDEAGHLGVSPGAPLLEMDRRCFSESGSAVESCRSLYRGDRYDLLVELSR